MDSDDEYVVPSHKNPKEGDGSVKINAEKRSEVAKRDRNSFIDFEDYDYNGVHKDDDVAGRVKWRIKAEGSFVLGDVLNSSGQSLHDLVVLEKVQTSNVKAAKETVTPLIKSDPDGHLIKSPSDLGLVKIEPRGTANTSKGKLWKFHGEMVADLTREDVLCMEAVCVLHKHRSLVQDSLKSSTSDDLLRKASTLAEFLTNGDPQRKLRRSLVELKNSDHSISECREIAVESLKQLFELYKNDEDLFVSRS